MKYHALLAELVGTFLLCFAVLYSILNATVIITPMLAALTLGVIVYIFGHTSGAHVNPAVTIGLMSVNLIKPMQAAAYVVAQILGAALAFVLATALAGPITLPIIATDTWPILTAEMLGAGILTMAVSSVARHKTPHEISGLLVGASLLMGISFAVSVGSSGLLNPAVATSLGFLNWSYLLGPMVGGVVGAWIYKLVAVKD